MRFCNPLVPSCIESWNLTLLAPWFVESLQLATSQANTRTATPKSAADYAVRVQAKLKSAWLPHIYRERIRKARTRAYNFEKLKPKARVEVQHTLLGVELKIGQRRLLCPDLATARYLSVFARAGCEEVAVPYDITKISQLADELESSWHRMLLLVDHLASQKSEAFRNRIKQLLLAAIRNEIAEAGAGASVPEFKQSTRQRF
jgi:hypothetical protein